MGGVTVKLTNTDKMYFPDDGLTKGDIIDYYRMVSSRMLPYLRDRPMAMRRYPDGITGEGIVHKNVPGYFPDWVNRTEVERRGRDGAVCQVVCDTPATLIYLANQASIEMHLLLSRVGDLEHPDQLVFDLDPADSDHFEDVRRCALDLRSLLEDDLGLAAYLKTTGGKGLHVHVPLRPEDDFDAVRDFARQVAQILVRENPRRLTIEQRIEQRGGKTYLDVMRNGYAQMAVAPYSVRARGGAPVATPLHWEEAEDSGLRPGWFTIGTLAERLEAVADPWAGMSRRRRGLAGARRKLESMA